MSKFKVGDRVVVCGGDVKTIARIDKWSDGEYGYYFNVDDELLNYQRECDLELYKTPHERLLELGYVVSKNISDKKGNIISIEYKKNETYDEHKITYNLIKIDLESKMFNAWCIYRGNPNSFWNSNDAMWIDKELAGILYQYLEERK